MIKAWIFDLDGTLYDYHSANGLAFRAMADYACRILDLSEEDFAALHKEADRTLCLRIGAETASTHDRTLRCQLILERLGAPLSYAPKIAERYWETFLAVMRPFPGAAERLAAVRAAGYRVGLGTNMIARYQYAKLERLGLLDAIDFLVTSEEAGAEKPDGRLFALCAEKAGCRPEECVFVGDDLKRDALGALAAGMRPVWICSGDVPETPPGVWRVGSLAEIPLQARRWEDPAD